MKPDHARGTVIISIDLELAWGNGGKKHFIPLHRKEREAIDAFLLLCERYDIPCTWATVGNLFLKDAQEAKDRGIVLTEKAKHTYALIDASNEGLWFGADIIEQILRCKVTQEIGCHTMFHTLAPEATAASFRDELVQTTTLAKEKYDITMRSFVYARNYVAHETVLRGVGFTSFRGHHVAHSFPSPFGETKLAHYIESLLPLSVPAVHPLKHTDGVIELPASYFLGTVLAKNVSVPMWLRMMRCKNGVQGAIQDRGIFHMWFHPHNLAQNIPAWMDTIEKLFQLLSKERAAQHIVVNTMGSYTEQYLNQE